MENRLQRGKPSTGGLRSQTREEINWAYSNLEDDINYQWASSTGGLTADLTGQLLRGKHYRVGPEDPEITMHKMWWRYANFSAHSKHITSCNVCFRMPDVPPVRKEELKNSHWTQQCLSKSSPQLGRNLYYCFSSNKRRWSFPKQPLDILSTWIASANVTNSTIHGHVECLTRWNIINLAHGSTTSDGARYLTWSSRRCLCFGQRSMLYFHSRSHQRRRSYHRRPHNAKGCDASIHELF